MMLAGLTVSAGLTWGGTVDSNPADFPTTVSWCQFDCTSGTGSLLDPTPWLSSGADTGLVGLAFTGQNLSVTQQGTNPHQVNGGFASGMGLLYNGASTGNIPADIALLFDTPEQGVGAWLQSNVYGAFTATLTLYDVTGSVVLANFTESGTSAAGSGAIFLGAYDATADIGVALFDVVGTGPNEPDFHMGTAGLYEPQANTPEPASMLLIAPALLGLAAFHRQRMMSFWKGNN